MKKTICAGLLLLSVFITQSSSAQTSEGLEEACFMDVELTDYLVQLIETGSSDMENVVTTEESVQIVELLKREENQTLKTVSKKLNMVLTACAKGQILQNKHSTLINP